ncbi:MAG: c-type cytochrome [Verrucomicrobiales bacterium]|jgi:cytochrome c553|nr:c-type cytochrome [Verrucomicrobiales bacterium]MBP9222348.1 c-type cytochrome [Verrucomicrobiales bacterium]HQZ26841.1 c-type cytochrome [Verrucomicrobiales bacterium]
MNRLSHKFLRFVLFLLVGIGGISCSEPPSPEELAAAEQVGAPGIYAQVCAACHGAAGEGKEELFSPSITGLPVWYVEEQLQKFRGEQRGIHPEDVPGQQMRAISLTLTDEQIAEATAAVAAMPIIRTQPTTEPFDLEKARYRYANECMECHRYNGMGDRVFHSAPLVTLNRSYLRRQLENYRGGRRGVVEEDLYGQKMVAITQRLTDEEIELFVNYIGALAQGDDPREAREK